MKFFAPILLLITTVAHASTLPGFRVETIAEVPGFISSVVVDSKGTIYCTTTEGGIYRIEGDHGVAIASLPTHEGGNAGLLGMALLSDQTAIVHYTTWSESRVLDDVISSVDLASGAETVLHAFVCDVELRDRGASSEHHGGNPTVASDGSIFVGIGEYNDFQLAQLPNWNGGKIFRIDRDHNVTQFARGLRNPYDLAWDPDLQRIVVSDNGPSAGDEIHIIDEGSNCGWPETFGFEPAVPGTVPPDYVFAETVAPTGLLRLTRDANAMLRRGYLLGAFVTHALYYFPDLTKKPIPNPYAIVDGFNEAIIDLTQAPNGDIYIATATFVGKSHIQRLRVPPRGDCNGDGFVTSSDVLPEMREIDDGDSHPMVTAQDGNYPGSWGCDVNADGVINSMDMDALARMLIRRRVVR